jgi:hypothetical protein
MWSSRYSIQSTCLPRYGPVPSRFLLYEVAGGRNPIRTARLSLPQTARLRCESSSLFGWLNEKGCSASAPVCPMHAFLLLPLFLAPARLFHAGCLLCTVCK